MQYLHDEYAVLMVQNTTNSETSRIFRSFRRNTSAFTPEVIQDLRNAATIVAAGQLPGGTGSNSRQYTYNRGEGRSRFGRYNNYRGRGRGFYPYARRGGNYSDVYSNLSQQIPPARPNSAEEGTPY